MDDKKSCDPNMCHPVFTGKPCKCYTNINTNKPYEDQFCGYQDGERFVACSPGCCKPMCPRKDCPSVNPRAPDDVVRTQNMNIVSNVEEVEKKVNFEKKFDLFINIIMILATITTLAIAIPPKLDLKKLFTTYNRT